MSQLINFPVDGGGVVIEVDGPPSGPVMRGLHPREQLEKVTEAAQESLDTSLGRIRLVTQSLGESVRDLPNAPDEITVEFGVAIRGEIGAVITKASADANFKFSLTWHLAPRDAPARPETQRLPSSESTPSA